MTTKSSPAVPKAWSAGHWSERRAELLTLPKRVRVLLAAEWAQSVLPIFEARRPNDERPRKAIEAAVEWAKEPSAAAAAYAAAAYVPKNRLRFLRLSASLALEILIDMKSPGAEWISENAVEKLRTA